MPGKLPIDRVRASERANQPRFDKEREKFAKKEDDLEKKAGAYGDDLPDKPAAPKPEPPEESI